MLAVIANGGIALTGESLQLRPVGDLHRASAVFDQAGLLQQSRRKGHTGAVRSQHGGQEIMCDFQQRRRGTVLGHQQPTREPLFDFVEPVTRRGLRHLHPEKHQVAGQRVAQVWERWLTLFERRRF